MREKYLLGLFLCLALLICICSASYAADKVGYINLRRLVNESKMGKEARENLQNMRLDREAELKKKILSYNTLKESIQKEGEKMTPEEKNEKINELRKAYKQYQRLLEDVKEEIEREDKELVAIILQKADSALKKVAKKNGYTIILKDSNAIGYLDSSVDITDPVLKELNKK